MRHTRLTQLQRLGILAIAALTLATPVLAKKTQSVSSISTLKSDATAHVQALNRNTVSPPRRNPRVANPFDQVFGLHMSEIFSRTHANAPLGSSGLSQPVANGVDGSAVNFPGFVSAPFVSFNNGDSQRTFSSVTADFNNDGYPDVATVQTDGTLNVVLNPGSGATLTSATPLPANTTANPYDPFVSWLVVADMNNDNIPDLIAQDPENNQVVVWLGKGDGTFQNADIYTISPGWNGSGGFMLVGDFNGDGYPDVAVLAVIPSFQNGSFQTTLTQQTYLNAGGHSGKLLPPTKPTTVTFNDLYDTNFGEAAVATSDGVTASGIAFTVYDAGATIPANVGYDILYIASNGDGTFTPPVEASGPAVIDPYDGFSDGSFYATSLRSGSSSSELKTSSKNARPYSTANLPTTDIVFAEGDGAVYDVPLTPGKTSFDVTSSSLLVGASEYFPSCGSCGEAHPKSGIKAAVNGVNAVSNTDFTIPDQFILNMADINGDGLLDLIVYAGGLVYIYPNTGGGTFSAPPVQVIGDFGGDQQPQPADFDGSGYNSLIYVDYTLNQVAYFQNLGGLSNAAPGQFYAAAPVSGISSNAGTTYTALGGNIYVQATADFNGDGLQDVVAYDWSNSPANGYYPDIVLGINNGVPDGPNEVNGFTFTTAVPGSSLGGLDFAYVEPLTITNSAGISILVATHHGLSISTATSGGTFSAPTALNLGVTLACAPGYADVGDINGDGIPDIVVAYGGDTSCSGNGGPTSSGYFTLLGAPGGTFAPITFTPYGSSLYQVRLISFSGAKGYLDLVTDDANFSNYVFDVHVIPNMGNSSGTFNTAAEVSPAPNYVVTDIVPGDYNSDGKQDLTLLTQGQFDPSSGNLVPNSEGVLQIPGNGNYTFGTPTLIDPGYLLIWGSYADFNNDGYPDLALTNYVPDEYPPLPLQPMVQIIPNLGGGTFGPPINEVDAYFFIPSGTNSAYTFTGNFGNTGGNDLLVTGSLSSAVFLNQGSDSLALSSSLASAGQGTPVTLTAAIKQNIIGPVAQGTVSFYANQTLLGTQTMANGSATFTTAGLPPGSEAITATYSGDPAHNTASASLTVAITAVTPAFALSGPSPAAISLTQGATGTVTLSLIANSTFSGAVQFTCSGAPAESSCSVTPVGVTLAPGQAATVSTVVATTAPNNTYQAKQEKHLPWPGALGTVSLAGLACLLWPKRKRFPRSVSLFAIAALALGLSTVMTGCSGGKKTVSIPPGNQYAGTPPGTSSLTITATSGSISQTQTIALTVTQAQ
jgi:Bacterial Ig-like domain (group 3)/FG-GAP-like repeat